MNGIELVVGWLPEKLKDILIKDDNLWKRNLIILSFALFVSSIGMSALMPFLSFYIRDLGVHKLEDVQLWSGFIYAAPFLTALIAVPIWGALADKYGRKLMIVRANLGLTVAVLLMAFVSSPTELLLVRLLQGFISGFIAATLGFATSNTPARRTGYALALLSAAQNAGNILGPFFGGIVSDISGIRSVFVFVAVLCFSAVILLVVFLKEKNFIKEKDKRVSVLDNLKFAFASPYLISILAMIIISQAGVFFTNPIFALYVESLNPPRQYLSTITGIMVAVIGLFSVITAPYWGRRNDKKPFYNTIIVAGIVSGASLILHIAVTNIIQLLILRSLMGLFLAAIVPTLFAAMNKGIPIEIKSGMMALASGATIFGNLISYLVSGFTAASIGMNACFIISGVLLFIAGLLGFIAKRYSKI